MNKHADISSNQGKQSKKYPLLPYSQLVFNMLKTNSDVYWTCFTVRLDKQKTDIQRFKESIEICLRNHPIALMHVDDDGMQYYEDREDILHGQYYSVCFRNENDAAYIDVAINRMIGDAVSLNILFEDVFQAYSGKILQPDFYLEYLDYIERQKALPRYLENRHWLESQFGNLQCDVRPQTDVPINIAEPLIEGLLTDDYTEYRESLISIGSEQLISVTAFFSLCAALAIMDYNGTDEAALTWAYDARETEKEQYIVGSLHRDVPFKLKVESGQLKDDLFRQTRNQMRSGIAHSSYPFTLTKPYSDIWDYAVNVIPQPAMGELLKSAPFEFDVIAPKTKEPNPAYSMLDIEIYDEERLTIVYRYSATHYKQESIRRFADLVKQNAIKLLQ